MLRREFFSAAVNNGKGFLFGSLLTVFSGLQLDNPNLIAGGAGLALGALLVNRQKYDAAPYPMLFANSVLTYNGVVLAMNGQPFAGIALAAANSLVGYGSANLQMLRGKISSQGHGVASILSSGFIGAAGISLQDPVLCTTAVAFMAEGVERAFNGPQSIRESTSDAFRSLTFQK